jgi:tetratricopeptide (TPR) repeat protein
MRALALLVPLAGAGTLAGAPHGLQGGRSDGAIQVAVRTSDDEYYVSLRADNAPLEQVLTKLTSELGYTLEGLADARRPTLITVALEDRRLDQVLEYVLGSVGMTYRLRTRAITVLPDTSAEMGRPELLQLAGAAYLQAFREHADHALAPAARLDQGSIAELQGYPGAALDHYQALIADYPRATQVPEAYMRSGLALERLGNWADAAEQFRAVANIEFAKEFAVPSRLELARCTIEVGDPQNALFLLTSLDATYPALDSVEQGKRALIRALALAGTGRYLEALSMLEAAEPSLSGPDRIEGLRVRAIALQGAGNPGDAGRGWLLYALETEEPTRAFALEQAAKLALAADDELGALFIVRQAEELGHKLRFEQYKAQAYERLGFATAQPESAQGMEERIAGAERALAAGKVAVASAGLSSYLVGSSALEPDLRVRLAIAWARCVDSAQGIDVALAHLREVRVALAGPTHLERRARLDVAAATLLEGREQYDQAADAYRGIY